MQIQARYAHLTLADKLAQMARDRENALQAAQDLLTYPCQVRAIQDPALTKRCGTMVMLSWEDDFSVVTLDELKFWGSQNRFDEIRSLWLFRREDGDTHATARHQRFIPLAIEALKLNKSQSLNLFPPLLDKAMAASPSMAMP